MDHRKELLLASAARLYSMGVDLEAARERLRQLVAQGVSYDSKATPHKSPSAHTGKNAP